MSTLTASVDLPPVSPSVPLARHLVLDLLRSWAAPHDREDAALLVTELVSNVVDHVQGQALLSLELALSDGWLRVSVADFSTEPPVVRRHPDDRARGRGLRLVEAVADRWGVERHHGGKRIWFELAPPCP